MRSKIILHKDVEINGEIKELGEWKCLKKLKYGNLSSPESSFQEIVQKIYSALIEIYL